MRGRVRSYIGIAFLCCITLFLIVYIGIQTISNTQSIATLEQGWSFARNGEAAQAQPGTQLAAYIFPAVSKGDVVTLSRRFTEPDETSRMLCFDTWHSITNVYLDGQLIYTQGEAYAQKGQMLGLVRHSVVLPDQYHGKTLTLSFTATEDNSMPYLTSVAFYGAEQASIVWFNRPLGLLFLGAFFVFLGTSIAFISCIFAIYKKSSVEQLMLGICVVLTGVYILSRGNFIQLLLPEPLVYNTIEYVSLFLLPLPILLYWRQDALSCRYQSVRWEFLICVFLNCAFLVGAVILNFTTELHLCQLLPLYYLLVLFVAVVVLSLIRFQTNLVSTLRKKIYVFGIGAFIMGAILSIVAFRLCYNTVIADMLRLWQWYNYILPFAMCVLVVFFSMSFAIDIKQLLEYSFRHEFLQYAAYSDVLTQLYNRRSFNEALELLAVDETYGIISIDLNDLKPVNDTLGHAVGDLMLESFSRLLTSICGPGTKAYRMGGDEFAVVVAEQPETTCLALTHRLMEAVDQFNSTPALFQLSVACGYATSLEAETANQVFQLADQRMYERKKEMKADGPGGGGALQA